MPEGASSTTVWSEVTLTYNNAPARGASATGGNPVAFTASSLNQFILIDVTPLVTGWANGSIALTGVDSHSPLAHSCLGGSFSHEIVRMVEIGNQPGLCRAPSQPFLRLRAGSGAVDTNEERKPAKMVGCLFLRLGDDRQVQAAADYLSDFSKRYALVRNPVIDGSGGSLLQR